MSKKNQQTEIEVEKIEVKEAVAVKPKKISKSYTVKQLKEMIAKLEKNWKLSRGIE